MADLIFLKGKPASLLVIVSLERPALMHCVEQFSLDSLQHLLVVPHPLASC